jgi:ATP phosphoribosyltransferase
MIKKKQRLRVATKYPNLTRDFLFSKGVTQFKLVDSLGATETYPFTGSSEIITDITSTGETLRANDLRVLKDGIILSSSACLFFSKNNKGLNKILNSLK